MRLIRKLFGRPVRPFLQPLRYAPLRQRREKKPSVVHIVVAMAIWNADPSNASAMR